MRSPLWFVVAGVIGLVGLACAYFYAMPRIGSFASSLHQVVMPGPVVVTLDRAGAYTLYAEVNAVVDGQLFSKPPPNGARITLASEATGKPVTLSAPHASVEYELGSRRGHAVLGFVIDQPGRYRLAASEPGDARYVLAIAYGSAMGSVVDLFRTIAITIAFVIGGLGLAGLLIAVTVIQRNKAKKAAAS